MITKLSRNNLEKWGHFCSEIYPNTTGELMIEAYNNGHFENEYLYQKNEYLLLL